MRKKTTSLLTFLNEFLLLGQAPRPGRRRSALGRTLRIEHLEERKLLTVALLNELGIDTPGADQPFEYVEIKGVPGSTLQNVYFVSFEGDGPPAAGIADLVVDLSGRAFGANGLMVIKADTGGYAPASQTTVVGLAGFRTGGPLENGTVSNMLIFSPTTPIVQTTDYDSDNDGSLTNNPAPAANLPADSVILDSIGWSDGGGTDRVYGTSLGSQTNRGVAVRFLENNRSNNASSWFWGTLSGSQGSTTFGTGTSISPNFPPGGAATPGAISVPGTNVAPVAVVDTYSVGQGESLQVSAGSGVLSNDSDANGLDQLLFAELVSGPANASSFTLGTDGSFSYVSNGTLGVDTFTYRTTDLQAFSSTVTVTISVTINNNVPPLLSVPNEAIGFVENAGPVTISTLGAITDADSADFGNGSLIAEVVTNGSSDDRLSVRNQGTASGEIGNNGGLITYGGITIGSATGGIGATALTVNLNGDATLIAVQALLRNVTYSNISEAPSTLNRIVQFRVNDGDGGPSNGLSNTQTQAVAITGVNDVPSLLAARSSFAYASNSGLAVTVDGSMVVTDVDLQDFDAGNLTVSITSNGIAAADSLIVRNIGVAAGQVGVSGTTVSFGGVAIGTLAGGFNGTSLTVTFNTSANQAAVQAVARAIAFQTTSTRLAPLARIITVSSTDGDGGSSNSLSYSVTQNQVRNFAFQEGLDAGQGLYSGTGDVQLYQGVPDQHFPAGRQPDTEGLLVDYDGGSINSAVLLKYDNLVGNGPGQIPANARVLSARLILTTINPGDGATIHRVLTNWDPGNATWNSVPASGSPPIRNNGVIARAAWDSQVGGPAGGGDTAAGLTNIGVAADVQAWVNGDVNHGWLLQGHNGMTDGWGFAASESSNPALRPRLEVDWVPETLQTTSFQQGVNNYSGTVDTALTSATPDTDNSASTGMMFVDFTDAGANPPNNSHVAMRFDNINGSSVDQVPAGALIHGAYLTLASTDNNGAGDGGQFYQLLQAWPSAPTWNGFVGGILNNGVEASATPTTVAGDPSRFPNIEGGWNYFNVTQDVQDWTNGVVANNGWGILPWDLGVDGWGIKPSESTDVRVRPRLQVAFTAVGVAVSPTTGLTTTESGGSSSFTVVLNTPPTADVIIPVSSSNTAEGTVSSNSLTFTPDNWDIPQFIHVNGIDDAADDGDIAYSVVVNAATSADINYNGLNANDVSVTNIDDDSSANSAPVAVDDSLSSIAEDSGNRTISIASLIANDSDVDLDSLSITAVGNAVGGTVSIVGSNVVFVPAANFNGAASFEYTLSDGSLTDTGLVTFTITAVNDGPVAVDDSLSTVAEDSGNRTISIASLIANDSDVDLDSLSITAVGNAVGGTVSIVGSNVVFVPAANFNGAASFEYTLSDGSLTDTGLVTFTITAVNDAPVAVDDSLSSIAEDSGNRTISISSLISNDNDVDGNTLSITAVSNAVGGTVSIVGSNVVFVPTLNFNGAASFEYTLSDGALTDAGLVSFTITAVNDGPTAGAVPNITVRQGAADFSLDLYSVFSDLETSDALLVYSVSGNTNSALFTSVTISLGTLTLDYNAVVFGSSVITVRATDEGSSFVEASFTVTVNYTLQLLHLADAEAGLLASTTAPNLAALVDAFDDDFSQTLILAGGDNWIPGPFLAGGTDAAVRTVLNQVSGSNITGTIPIAAVDIAIHNELGVEVSAIGNHEFDLGSRVFRDSFTPGGGWVGANFAHVSANLNFSGDAELSSRFTNTLDGGTGTLIPEASSLKGRIAPSVVVTKGGEKIGIVGATTQLIESISSPSGTEVSGFPGGPGPNGETDNMDLLAAQLQPVIDELRAEGINKIILMSHLQLISNEQSLATKLNGVDIILSAGSNTRLGDSDDVAVLFPGHAADFANNYPIITAGTDGKTTVIINTDNEFTYLGRLVVEFDAAGDINVTGLADLTSINGAYAATTTNVAAAWAADGGLSAAFAEGTKGEEVADLTEAVAAVITAKDGNISGFTDVYLQGERATIRNQETNLGNLTADANAAALVNALGSAAPLTFIASLKNGGGIRAQIGTVSAPDPLTGEVSFLPPAANSAAGKPVGSVSQLDIENSLRFNNSLMAFDTTAAGLKAILEHGVALLGNQGRFPQIGGVRFSFDPSAAAGSRVRNIVLIDENDVVIAAIVKNGIVSSVAPASITIVTLSFLANGGDGYPIKANGDNFRFLLTDGTLSAPINESLDFGSAANIPANVLGEQTALFDYMRAAFPGPGSAYNQADTPITADTRIQNLSQRSDGVFPANSSPTNINLTTSSLAENAGANSVIGSFSAVDPNVDDTFTFSLPAGLNSNSLFNISGTSLRATGSFDFEAGASYTITARVTDSGGLTFDKQFTITITDVNEATFDGNIFYNTSAAAEKNFSPDQTGQRSMIRNVQVVFNGNVAIPTGPVTNSSFILSRLGGSPMSIGLTVVSRIFAGGKTTVLLGFTSGTHSVSGSLNDGNYRLVIDYGVLGIDGDGNGQVGGLRTINFHRFFGDSDGDRDVDARDSANYRTGFRGNASWLALFDFDNDGVLLTGGLQDQQDKDAFFANFGRLLNSSL